MGHFDEQIVALGKLLDDSAARGELVELDVEKSADWPRGHSLVLSRDTALDLGSPAAGSMGFLMWTAPEESARKNRAFLVGPNIASLAAQAAGPLPFAQVIVVRGDVTADYNCYLEMKQALYALDLIGLTVRSQPSQNHLWLRLHADAVAKGFDFVHLATALIEGLERLDFVQQVDVIFLSTPSQLYQDLQPIADQCGRVVGAMIKRHEEENAECEECEYNDICEEKEHPK